MKQADGRGLIRAIVAWAWSFGLLTAAAQSVPAQSGADIAKVMQLLRSEDYQAAVDETQRLLAVRPHDCRLLGMSGLALNGMHRLTEAKHAFQEALDHCPNDLLALEGSAQIAYARKQPDAAQLLQRILVLRPGDVTTHAMLAAVDRSKQDCKAALPHFEASRSLFGTHPQLQEGYAFCLADTGDDTHAAENYREVLESHPGDDTARYNLAIVRARLHDSKAALETLQPLLNSSGEEAPLELGSRLAEDAGDTPLAVQLLREAILRQPKNADNYIRFAQLSFAHNSDKVGIDILNAGLTQLPDAGRLYLARGILEVQLSQFEQAIADFEKAHQLDPQLSLAMDAIGIMQSQQQQSKASLRLFADQARQHPEDGLLQYLYAQALSESQPATDWLAQALAAAERSVRIDPGYQPSRDLLALLYVSANQPERAISEAEAALKIDPDDQSALYQEMVARRHLGQTAEAQKLVHRLTELRRKTTEQQTQTNAYILKEEASQ